MAKQIAGVSERILSCAQDEFLAKGYTDASLRSIAAAAGTSTNSIYVRFGDKEGLFSALVEPALRGMLALFVQIQENFHQLPAAEQSAEMAGYSVRGADALTDYLYDHENIFRLLLDASYGTRFHRFVDEMVRIEVDYTYKYLETVGYPRKMGDAMTQMALHMVTTSHFEGIFEVIRHGMSREEARQYVALLGRYHHAGFETLFRPAKER